MKNLKIMTLGLMVLGTSWLQAQDQQHDLDLMEARVHFAAGEYSQAESIAKNVLKVNPENGEAKSLLKNIVDRDIAQEVENPSSKIIEELSPKEKQLEIERWLERAKTLRSLGQYDEAFYAAEQVFVYQPDHVAASHLLDEIQFEALESGRKNFRALNESAHREIQERVGNYFKQASQWMATNQLGAARLAVEKILLLEPQNEEALNLKRQIRKRLENEKRKTV